MKKGDKVYISDVSEADALKRKDECIYLFDTGGLRPHACVLSTDTFTYPDGDFNVVAWKYAVPVPRKMYRIKSIKGVLQALADLEDLSFDDMFIYSTHWNYSFRIEMLKHCGKEIPKPDNTELIYAFEYEWHPYMIEEIN